MKEQTQAPISAVDAAMPKAFLEGYTKAVTSIIPAELMDQASLIVAAHRPEGTIPGTEPLCMAGLKPTHHGDLNRPHMTYPGGKEARDKRIADLRSEYSEDKVAQQQIDVYADDTEYHVKLGKFKRALMSGNTAKEAELEAWFKEYYPDI
ncbi:MAG: hypothetical protein AAB660_01985 [Patescibacteria group bacterium]